MVGEEVIAAVPEVLIGPIKILVYVLQVLGIFIIFYVIFNIINATINRKRNKVIEKMAADVAEIKKSLARKR